MGLGDEGRCVDRDAPPIVFARGQDKIDDGLDILRRFRGVADHEVELELGKVELLGQRDGLHHLFFGLGLVDDVAQALAARLRGHGEIVGAGFGQRFDQRHADRVHAHGGGAQLGAHALEFGRQLVDLGVVADRRADEADARIAGSKRALGGGQQMGQGLLARGR